jgi:hypothetical protein
VEIEKGFMHLSKKCVPFIWDDQAQRSFQALEEALMSTPLLSPSDYSKYFLLYFVASKSTIGMVIVQEDNSHNEHVIYYLSKGLIDPKLHYSQDEKLTSAMVQVV